MRLDKCRTRPIEGDLRAQSHPSQTVSSSPIVQIKLSTPLNKCHCSSSIANHPISSGVILVLRQGFPFAISGLVSNSVIKSLKCMPTRWLWPHVSQECLKAVPPASTHGNSTSAIIMPLVAFWIRAAALHTLPYHPFRGVVSAIALWTLDVILVLHNKFILLCRALGCWFTARAFLL